MNRVLRFLFFAVLVRPFLLIILGLNVRRLAQLPKTGPSVVVANHNSHLDTFVLMSLFSLRRLPKLRPVAAADYFLKGRIMSWFATHIIGIIPIDRQVKSVHEHPLHRVYEALDREEIVIVFPEGSRGEPERLSRFKAGVAHLAKRNPKLLFHPVFLHGLGKTLPRGEALLVPFLCDVLIGEPFTWTGGKESFMGELTERMNALAKEGEFSEWN